MKEIQWVVNKLPKTKDEYLAYMSEAEVKKARNFHKSFPQYEETPLAHLSEMAKYLGIADVWVKDESYRFGLNAFKVLGGSYAMARYIAGEINDSIENMNYNRMISDELKEELGQVSFFTATDGNHGRGVAWAANKLGQKSVVRMPKGTTQTRLDNILKENAEATIEEVNYDECVRMAYEQSKAVERGVIVQDTAWEGYEEIPTWIMQGYGTMVHEAYEKLQEDHKRPTHIFMQAGVGSLAGAIQGFFANVYSDNPPTTVVVEPHVANCLYESAKAGDGERRIVDGDMATIMAGLACGEPNTISWDILKNHVDVFVSCDDSIAERGMRMLAAPFKGDKQVISGESGAVTFGLLATLLLDENYKELKGTLGLDENSRLLLFSTEGDTDPIRFKEIVWEAKNFKL